MSHATQQDCKINRMRGQCVIPEGSSAEVYIAGIPRLISPISSDSDYYRLLERRFRDRFKFGKLQKPFLFLCPPVTVHGAAMVAAMLPVTQDNGVTGAPVGSTIIRIIGVLRLAHSYYEDLGERRERDGGIVRPLYYSKLLREQHNHFFQKYKIYGDPEYVCECAESAYGAKLVRDGYKKRLVVLGCEPGFLARQSTYDLDACCRSLYVERGADHMRHRGFSCHAVVGLRNGINAINFAKYLYPAAAMAESAGAIVTGCDYAMREFVGSYPPLTCCVCLSCGYPIRHGHVCACGVGLPALRDADMRAVQAHLAYEHFLPARIFTAVKSEKADLRLYREGILGAQQEWASRELVNCGLESNTTGRKLSGVACRRFIDIPEEEQNLYEVRTH